ncbi:MAG: hypothetical protein A2Z52_01105 [Candidatus Moranbacteria bacterium RBG_19FT_COMBO_42_6]|nr:MAG: hypothetical protein A2Z52_01105 [Candidatus Moranbacteria bacterium RBG_19FT_COMBO_42_6]
MSPPQGKGVNILPSLKFYLAAFFGSKKVDNKPLLKHKSRRRQPRSEFSAVPLAGLKDIKPKIYYGVKAQKGG